MTYEERAELKEICKPLLDYLRTKFPDTNIKAEVDTTYDRVNLYKLSTGFSVFEPHTNYREEDLNNEKKIQLSDQSDPQNTELSRLINGQGDKVLCVKTADRNILTWESNAWNECRIIGGKTAVIIYKGSTVGFLCMDNVTHIYSYVNKNSNSR